MASSAAKPRAERDRQSVLAELARRSGLKDVARSGTRVVPLLHRMDNWSGGPCLKNARARALMVSRPGFGVRATLRWRKPD
jgi:hypothetical protein